MKYRLEKVKECDFVLYIDKCENCRHCVSITRDKGLCTNWDEDYVIRADASCGCWEPEETVTQKVICHSCNLPVSVAEYVEGECCCRDCLADTD